jgi:hypothetical protein|tara:strand:- start:293 stop:814 length:522 start_codon:yes stop_codon:yes gene_type:complete
MQRIDNFLPDDLFGPMQGLLMNGDLNQQMPWFYRYAMSDEYDTEGFVFGNDIFDRGQIPDMGLFEDIAWPITSRLPMSSLIRIKVNCHPRQTLRNTENYPKCRYHVDMFQEHMVAILSINSCNGYTEFEDGTKLESRENSLVIFDGKLKHRSVGQTDTNIRVNVNINFVREGV